MDNSSEPAVAISLRMYRALARAFPQEFRNAYEEELLQTTEDSIVLIWRRHGIWGLVCLLADIALRIPAEHFTELRSDVRYGMRTLSRSPGFAIVAMLSVSLGICAAAGLFSELNGTILRDVPGVNRPDELITLQQPISYPIYKRLAQTGIFSSALAYVAPVPFGVSLDGQNKRSWGHLVTPSYFATLGVRPTLGRLFDKQDENLHEGLPVVISYRFWQTYFGFDSSIIGKALRVNGQSCTVVGVGPKDFLGASPMMFVADLWMPVAAGTHVAPELSDNALERPQLAMFQMVGRLKPGISTTRAEAELNAAYRQAENDFGKSKTNKSEESITVASGGKLVPTRGQNIALLAMLPIVVITLILLIACSNVANMTLARAIDRRREVAIRLALGASRSRLVRQLLTESMLVAAGAGCVGFVLTGWLMHLLSRLHLPHTMPVTFSVEVDWKVLAFTTGLTAFTGLAFGLIPALHATRPELVLAMVDERR